MENDKATNSNQSDLKTYFLVILIISIFVASVAGYSLGKNSNSDNANSKSNNLISPAKQMSDTPTQSPYIIPATTSSALNNANDQKVCSKYGFAQKWEYLTPYTVKANDTLESVAEGQLNDKTRVNEILAINGSGPYVVGSTLYLPPQTVSKSSGNLKQFYGKLTEKDASYWHLTLSSDPSGQSLLIPAFLFEKVLNKDSFKKGDCVKIFLDDGYQVYTISLQ